MKLVFKDQLLVDLYEGKKVKDKRFRSNPQLKKQYQKTVTRLRNITRIEQLYQIQSLHYEKKTGDLKGKSAVWINRQYRLIFQEIASADEPKRIEVLELEKISKHYED